MKKYPHVQGLQKSRLIIWVMRKNLLTVRIIVKERFFGLNCCLTVKNLIVFYIHFPSGLNLYLTLNRLINKTYPNGTYASRYDNPCSLTTIVLSAISIYVKNYSLDKWHTLEFRTTIVWNNIQIQNCSKELWPGHIFWLCVHSRFDLGEMTSIQGHDTPLGHGQQLCIISRSNMTVSNHGMATDLGYVCTVTLAFDIWPWNKVISHPRVIDNNCVKFYQELPW